MARENWEGNKIGMVVCKCYAMTNSSRYRLVVNKDGVWQV